MADTPVTPTPAAPVDPKLAITSSTIWGIAISVLPGILKAFHINLAPGWDAAAADFTAATVQAFGAILAIWGRFKADRKLVLLPPSK